MGEEVGRPWMNQRMSSSTISSRSFSMPVRVAANSSKRARAAANRSLIAERTLWQPAVLWGICTRSLTRRTASNFTSSASSLPLSAIGVSQPSKRRHAPGRYRAFGDFRGESGLRAGRHTCGSPIASSRSRRRGDCRTPASLDSAASRSQVPDQRLACLAGIIPICLANERDRTEALGATHVAYPT